MQLNESKERKTIKTIMSNKMQWKEMIYNDTYNKKQSE